MKLGPPHVGLFAYFETGSHIFQVVQAFTFIYFLFYFFSFSYLLLLCIECFAYMDIYMCKACAPSAHGGQKKLVDLLG